MREVARVPSCLQKRHLEPQAAQRIVQHSGLTPGSTQPNLPRPFRARRFALAGAGHLRTTRSRTTDNWRAEGSRFLRLSASTENAFTEPRTTAGAEGNGASPRARPGFGDGVEAMLWAEPQAGAVIGAAHTFGKGGRGRQLAMHRGGSQRSLRDWLGARGRALSR